MTSKPISISLGGSKINSKKPSSFSLTNGRPSTSKSLPGAKPLNPRKRPHSSTLGGDSDSDSDAEDHAAASKATAVTGFDSTGAISAAPKESPKAQRIINGPRNRDWRAEIEKRRGGTGAGEKHSEERESKQQNGGGGGDKLKGGPAAYGLVITKRQKTQDDETSTPLAEAPAAEEEEQKTDEQLALDALISGKNPSAAPISIIPATSSSSNGNGTNGYISETAAFKTDLASRPPPASTSDYRAVPIEGFGAALLRGMGWKDGQGVGKRTKADVVVPEPKARRPGLLGVGAKEGKGAEGVEMGAWNIRKSGKGGKEKEAYTPVVLRNRATGEMVSEKELERRREEEKELREKEREQKRRDGGDGDRGSRKKEWKYASESDSEEERERRRRRREKDERRRRDRSRSRDADADDRRRRREREDGRYYEDRRRDRDRDRRKDRETRVY